MQMNNIFKKSIIANYIFGLYYSLKNIKLDLLTYLFDNLQKENYETFLWDLKTALKINANGEYI
jgi:hypothetical protein